MDINELDEQYEQMANGGGTATLQRKHTQGVTSKGGIGVYGSGHSELRRNMTLSGRPALQVNASFNAQDSDALDSQGGGAFSSQQHRRESRSVDGR